MIFVKFVYDNPSDKDRLLSQNNKEAFIEFIDEGSYKEKKQAYKLKSSCGAKITPFAAVFE